MVKLRNCYIASWHGGTVSRASDLRSRDLRGFDTHHNSVITWYWPKGSDDVQLQAW